MRKRGISPVIATTLIILLTIVTAGIIAPFVINFVNSNLDESGSCFDNLGDLEITETKFNCHAVNTTSGTQGTGFSVRINNKDIVGFKVSLLQDGSSDTYEIINNTNDPLVTGHIRMLNADFGGILDPPQSGGVRTYVANGTYDRIELFPVLASGKLCGVAESVDFDVCLDPVAFEKVTKY